MGTNGGSAGCAAILRLPLPTVVESGRRKWSSKVVVESGRLAPRDERKPLERMFLWSGYSDLSTPTNPPPGASDTRSGDEDVADRFTFRTSLG
jgi:hypothetical protein